MAILTFLIVIFVLHRDDLSEPLLKWHVYVTGHSLGGALATLLALELSSSQLAKYAVYLSAYMVLHSYIILKINFIDISGLCIRKLWKANLTFL